MATKDENEMTIDEEETTKNKAVDKSSQAHKTNAKEDSGRKLRKQKSDPAVDQLTIGDPWKHKERACQNFYIGDPRRSTASPSTASTVGSTTEQEGGYFWGRMGMLSLTTKIDLSNGWDEDVKVHQEYVDNDITLERKECATAIAGIIMKVEQHAINISKSKCRSRRPTSRT